MLEHRSEAITFTPGANDFCKPCPLRPKEGETAVAPTIADCDTRLMQASTAEQVPARTASSYTLYEDSAAICALRDFYAPGIGIVRRPNAFPPHKQA